jgi:hypothetical protein
MLEGKNLAEEGGKLFRPKVDGTCEVDPFDFQDGIYLLDNQREPAVYRKKTRRHQPRVLSSPKRSRKIAPEVTD